MRNYIRFFSIYCFSLGVILSFNACQNANSPDPIISPSEYSTAIFTDAATIVIYPVYRDLASNSKLLQTKVNAFTANPTQENLVAAQNQWRATRESWELSEAFLFGPVSSENIDPGIDTWPVNRSDMDSLLRATTTINETFVAEQQESLKGFHPLEYMLFGMDGNKTATAFTFQELAYAKALATYLVNQTTILEQNWNPSNGQSFHNEFTNSGKGSTTYTKKLDGMLELVNAIAGICGEVGEGKINEVVVSQNPELEESPFSKNSMTDFRKNIEGVSNLYYCTYKGQTGTSLSGFVKQYNRSLDQKIANQISLCKQSASLVNVPFSEAIFTQQQQLNKVTESLNSLEEIIQNELVPLLRLRITN